MKVAVFSPTYFHGNSFIGGAERYVEELSQALSSKAEVTLISFGTKREKHPQESFRKEIYPVWWFWKKNRLNPFNLLSLLEVRKADVVYVHGVSTFMSDLVCLTASLLGKPVFVMDHGGGGNLVLSNKLPVFDHYTGAIAQSTFARNFLPPTLQDRAHIIKGGINLSKFTLKMKESEKKRILFVGRLLPHKGVDQLIRACKLLPSKDWHLVIIGRPYNERYWQDLQKLSEGASIEFVHSADDNRLIEEYQKASVLVLPSTQRDCYGNQSNAPEFMGFVLLEAQACGTPVICSDAGAMVEFIDPEKTGWVVPQSDPPALARTLETAFQLQEKEGARLPHTCREWVKHFSWDRVTDQLLNVFN